MLLFMTCTYGASFRNCIPKLPLTYMPLFWIVLYRKLTAVDISVDNNGGVSQVYRCLGFGLEKVE